MPGERTTDSRQSPARPIRLLWLIDSLAIGGAERLVVSFARCFNRDRFDLQVYCLKTINGNPMAADLAREGISTTVLDARHLRDVTAFRRLMRASSCLSRIHGFGSLRSGSSASGISIALRTMAASSRPYRSA